MEEMRQLIGRRQGNGTPRSRPHSDVLDLPDLNHVKMIDVSRSIELLASQVEADLVRALLSQDALQKDLTVVAAELKEVQQSNITHCCYLLTSAIETN
jgi:protein ECT2